MKLEIIKPVVKVGNSAGVVLPKEWLNGKAKIELVEKPLNIKEDIIEILKPYLEDIIGIYVVGSYARSEQTEKSDIDVLVISKNTGKKIISGKYEITIASLGAVLSVLKEYPERIYPKFLDAKVILNKALLEELREIKLTKNSFKQYFKDSKEMIKRNRELIEMDRTEGNILESEVVVYSLLLRLRALYMIRSILKNEKYTNKDFRNWLIRKLRINNKEYEKLHAIYGAVRDNKKVRDKISISLAKNLADILQKEINKYGEKKKKA